MEGTHIANNKDSEHTFVFDASSVTILQAVFAETETPITPKSVSIKFMITLQDENDLISLGYTLDQIRKMKPQDAEDKIRDGRLSK